MKQIIVLLSYGFDWVLQTSLLASVTVVLLLLVKWMLKGRINIRWQYALWFLLLFRLLMPWSLESPFSMYQFFIVDRNESTHSLLDVPLSQPGTLKEGNDNTQHGPLLYSLVSFNETDNISMILPFSRIYVSLMLIWIAVTIGIFGLIYVQHRRFSKLLKSILPVNDVMLQTEFKRCKQAMRIRAELPLYLSNQVKSPTLCGFLKPRLLLPLDLSERLDTREASHIFFHELSHYKRKDIGVNWLMTGLLTLHWFNPLLWAAYSRMREEQEQACDALALSYLGSDQAVSYGQTLVMLLESTRVQGYMGAANFYTSKSGLYRRIQLIKGFHVKSYRWSFFGFVVLVILAVSSLTSAISENKMGNPDNGVPDIPKIVETSTNSFSNNDKNAVVELDERPSIISGLIFTISGKINGLSQNYFFYQIEDGHGYLSEGRIDVRENGTFKMDLSIKPPSNEYGLLSFYLDANDDGVFDVELDTEHRLASYELKFNQSLVIP
ncbi:M56 family metallopeptidase [Paenibacillus albiflavus]|uniref:M56 family metallopeptidase n=1 Tax=Paenibacillus albiflavus TaxID=2545760 RepID=A0A4R4ENS4_9BACL|nr:M56 family metallopeptidase [Paenibacillus albiflavus]TCZ81100.1 M56 family metallopeptidase [Paenibacillus albiflavus]